MPNSNIEQKNFLDQQRKKIAALCKMVYQCQDMRIAAGNRVVAAIRPDLITPPASLRNATQDADESALDKDDEEQAKEAKSFLKKAYGEYKLITDAYVAYIREHRTLAADHDLRPIALREKTLESILGKQESSLSAIKDSLSYHLMRNYDIQRQAEADALKALEVAVQKHPLWDDFLKDVTGCGPLMAGVIISSIDIHKAEHVSSLWKYAGLDVLPNGQGRARYHATMVEYIDKEGNKSKKKSLGYNPFLKTKLIGVLGSSFLRAGRTEKNTYGLIYYKSKDRYENRPDLMVTTLHAAAKGAGTITSILAVGDKVKKGDAIAIIESNGESIALHATQNGTISKAFVKPGEYVNSKQLVAEYEIPGANKARIHRMATRYAVKMFLRDLWIHWRALEGYDVSNPDYTVLPKAQP